MKGERKLVLQATIKGCKLLIHLFASTKWQYDETMSNSNRGKILVLEEQSLVTKSRPRDPCLTDFIVHPLHENLHNHMRH